MTSSASKMSDNKLEPMNLSTGKIRMLKHRYGLRIGSTHVVVGVTPSKLHWLLDNGKHVNKKKHADHWKWIASDDTPVGQKRKLNDAESDRDLLKQLQLVGSVVDVVRALPLLEEATRLGSRWMSVRDRNPEAFNLMLSQLQELEKGNPIQEPTQEQSQIDVAQSAVKCNSAAEADSGGASKVRMRRPHRTDRPCGVVWDVRAGPIPGAHALHRRLAAAVRQCRRLLRPHRSDCRATLRRHTTATA